MDGKLKVVWCWCSIIIAIWVGIILKPDADHNEQSTQLKTHFHQKWTKIQLLTTDALISCLWYFCRADHRDAPSWFWNSFVTVSAGSFDKCQLQTQSSSWTYLTYWSQMCSIIIFVGRWLVSLTIRVDSFLSVWFFWGGGWCFITTLSVMVTSAVFESW